MHWFEYVLTGFKMELPTTGLSVCPTCGTTLTPTVIANTDVISVEMCFPAREKFTCTFKSTIPLTFTVWNAM